MASRGVNKVIIGLSLFFAAVHFLKPPEGSDVSNGHDALAGFELLGLIGKKYLAPASFFGTFITLFAVGVVLAFARHRSGALWLSIGLHGGWIFCVKFFEGLFYNNSKAHPVLFGEKVTDGIIPLCFVILTGISVYYYLRPKPIQPLND